MDRARLTPEQRKRVEQTARRVAPMAQAISSLVSHLSVDDLQSAGYEGLVEAALRYDPAVGVPFGAFAHYRIRGAMLDAARRASPAIRRRTRAMRTLEVTQDLLEHARLTAPRPEAGDARSLRERVAAAAELVNATTTAVLLSKVAPEDPDDVPASTIPDAEVHVFAAEQRDAIQNALAQCEAGERALIEALYFEGQTMTQYAAAIGSSKSTVSRHHARALRRLSALLRHRVEEGQ